MLQHINFVNNISGFLGTGLCYKKCFTDTQKKKKNLDYKEIDDD